MFMTATLTHASAEWLHEVLEKVIGFFPRRNRNDVGPWDQK